ncbi:hypothetical protein EPI10_028388 [Gossypium australe]|uniref:RNase H type-1 domain-containing protein n=1 Tax=Gossypium australe TaxID=47621 RepID=A0A5B6UX24_9ROSI|nr:hypothetical protein EPI10_028388 [Gossypium australe]
MEVIWAEREAFNKGIKLAARLKVDRLILESDSAKLVNTVNKRTQDITIMGQRIKQDWELFTLQFTRVK